jgi:hypothetical protein
MKRDNKEYIFTPCKSFSTSKTKIEKSFHPSTEVFASLIVNHEEHLMKSVSGIGASSSIFEVYASALSINTDDSNTTTWSTMGGTFTTTKTGIYL